MNKLLLALSMASVLAACASEPAAKDPNALEPGIMQPVEGTGAIGGGSFMPEIQQGNLPATMN